MDLCVLCGTLLELLKKKGETLAVSESCTGGMIASALVGFAGCSEVFHGGTVVYTNKLKHELLGVPEDIFSGPGAVSAECIEAMLNGTLAVLQVSCAIAVSGIAGPGGAVPGKPVGTVFIGAAAGEKKKIVRLALSGSRDEVRTQSACEAVKLLTDLLQGIQ